VREELRLEYGKRVSRKKVARLMRENGLNALSPTPNPQAGGPPLVGCLRLLIQHIRSYPRKLEGVSSIRNLRTRHAVVTRDPPNMGENNIRDQKMKGTFYGL
jgi:transposase InsO family protein